MRLTSRDWIVSTLVAAIVLVAGFFYVQVLENGPAGVYRIVVTADRP